MRAFEANAGEAGPWPCDDLAVRRPVYDDNAGTSSRKKGFGTNRSLGVKLHC